MRASLTAFLALLLVLTAAVPAQPQKLLTTPAPGISQGSGIITSPQAAPPAVQPRKPHKRLIAILIAAGAGALALVLILTHHRQQCGNGGVPPACITPQPTLGSASARG